MGEREAFLRSQVRRGLADGTIDRRRLVLERFAEWLHPRSLLQASTEDVQRFLDARQLGSSRTRYGWISHLHCFYEWALAEGLTDCDPTGRIDRPKLRKLLPRPIGEADLALALDMAGGMMTAWLTLAAYAGLRCAEIARLDVPDVDMTGLTLRVLGKGDNERVVPMHQRVEVEVRHWIYGRRSGAVFLRPRGGRYPPAMVSREGRLFLESCGIDATMHQLRHRFATKALEGCGDLRAVQELLGHASPATTAIYTQVTSSRLRVVVDGIGTTDAPWQPSLQLGDGGSLRGHD